MATMRKVGIRQLRDNLSRELKDLPLAIASDGQVVATILSIEGYKHLVKGYKGSGHKLDKANDSVNHSDPDFIVTSGGVRLNIIK